MIRNPVDLLPENDASDLNIRLHAWELLDSPADPTHTCPECCEEHHVKVSTWHGFHPQHVAAATAEPAKATLVAAQSLADGEAVFTMRASQTPAAWPMILQGPLGLPLCDSLHFDNIDWQSSRCAACNQWLLTARASRPIASGEALRGPGPPLTLFLPNSAEPEYQLSFGGGARHNAPHATLDPDGPRTAGAGAALWGPVNARGRRECVAQMTLAAPSLSCSLHAEALGLRAALALADLTLGSPRHIRVVGDNLPVLRMAATNGRIRTPGIWEILEAPLVHASVQNWNCAWVAVRRKFNTVADGLATIGTQAAVQMAAGGDWTQSIRLWIQNPPRHFSSSLAWHQQWAVSLEENPLFDTAGI